MIRAIELSKSFGERKAVDGLSFEARQGEILGFLGPNGAGKTTTMRMLTGFLPPTSGTATIAGFDIIDNSFDARKHIGYLPESVPLYEDMTLYDYLSFFAELRHIPEPKKNVLETLEQVGLQDRSEGYIANLSKGMRQRLGLAQALLHKPNVLILDEPTIGLDPVQIREVRNLIKDIGKEKTVLLSTHILSEAQQLCDRILIINKGKIVVEDSPANLQTILTGAERVFLRINGDINYLAKKILQITNIQKVIENPKDGTLEFQYTKGKDPRPEVARIVLESNFELLEMHLIHLSLEDIFMELTRNDEATPSE